MLTTQENDTEGNQGRYLLVQTTEALGVCSPTSVASLGK